MSLQSQSGKDRLGQTQKVYLQTATCTPRKRINSKLRRAALLRPRANRPCRAALSQRLNGVKARRRDKKVGKNAHWDQLYFQHPAHSHVLTLVDGELRLTGLNPHVFLYL